MKILDLKQNNEQRKKQYTGKYGNGYLSEMKKAYFTYCS